MNKLERYLSEPVGRCSHCDRLHPLDEHGIMVAHSRPVAITAVGQQTRFVMRDCPGSRTAAPATTRAAATASVTIGEW